MFRVEYLITVDQKDAFCRTPSAFNNLLRTIDKLTISKSMIDFAGLSVSYELQSGEVSTDKQRFFHLRLAVDAESQLPQFEELLRSVRGVLSKAGGKPPQTLGMVSACNTRNAPIRSCMSSRTQ